ncbi:hypothetical protein SDC9_196277 [bioreactor metagenome]|uniref:Uncharacterized protein n=1 Tax=bioreactor metagenome TaxID=1076179 RepID=A0A645IBL7_9ZZZZ
MAPHILASNIALQRLAQVIDAALVDVPHPRHRSVGVVKTGRGKIRGVGGDVWGHRGLLAMRSAISVTQNNGRSAARAPSLRTLNSCCTKIIISCIVTKEPHDGHHCTLSHRQGRWRQRPNLAGQAVRWSPGTGGRIRAWRLAGAHGHRRS